MKRECNCSDEDRQCLNKCFKKSRGPKKLPRLSQGGTPIEDRID